MGEADGGRGGGEKGSGGERAGTECSGPKKKHLGRDVRKTQRAEARRSLAEELSEATPCFEGSGFLLTWGLLRGEHVICFSMAFFGCSVVFICCSMVFFVFHEFSFVVQQP